MARPVCCDPFCVAVGSCREGSRLMRRTKVRLLPENEGRRRAVKVIGACLVVLFADAEAFGGDVGPSNAAGYACNAVVLLVLIPLFGAVISFFTSGLTETHVKAETAKLHAKMDAHHAEHAGKLDEIHRK